MPHFKRQFHPAVITRHREHHGYSIQELTSLFVSGLEDARKLNGNVDARRVIAEVNEGLDRNDRVLEKRELGDDDHVYEEAPEAPRAMDMPTKSVVARADQNERFARLRSPQDAAAPWRGEAGIKLGLCTWVASIHTPCDVLNFSHQAAEMVLGFRKIGFSLRIQFAVGRKGTRVAPAAKASTKLRFGTAACSIVAAALLLCAISVSPAKPPQRLQISSVEPEHKSEPSLYLPISSPISSMLNWPHEQKPPELGPTELAIGAAEHVATRATTKIRSRPANRASIVRVVPGRLVLNVHARSGDWIEVGGTQAWGWVPSYLVEPFALKS
ncbi:MAG: hypothetical protein JO188_15565 [Hyphomicrobiales bacterium]|nr:hypothetical protein [Hyphomicrobiales bacterium]